MSVALELFIRNAISLAALVVTLCETISNLEDELRFIWRRPINWVKGAYLVTRYSALVGFVINILLLFCGPLGSYPIRNKDCRSWLTLFCGISYIPVVGILTLSLIITQIIVVSVSGTQFMDTTRYTPVCQISITLRQVLGYVIWLVGTQLTLIGLTFYKRRSLSDVLQGTTIDFALQQGIFLCLIISAVSLAASIHSLMTGFSDPVTLALLPSVLTSSALCRIILALQRATSINPRPRPTANDFDAKEMIKFDQQLARWLAPPSGEVEEDFSQSGRGSVLRHRFCPSPVQLGRLRGS